MNIHPTADHIMAWGDHELEAADAAEVERHLEACESCRRVSREHEALRRDARRWTVEPAPSRIRDAVARAMATTSASTAAPSALPASATFWQRYRWQTVAASVLLFAAVVLTQITVCGTTICYARTATDAGSARSGATRKPQSVPDFGIARDGASVLVVWFVDYECPACAAAEPAYHPALDRIAAEHPGQVKVVVRDWPWNTDCNPNIPQTFSGHEASCVAAVAVRLAGPRGTAPALRSWLFGHQGASQDEVREAAASVGSIPDFAERYPAEVEKLQDELAALAGSGVHSTPGCYVNGVSILNSMNRLPPVSSLDAIVREALSTKTVRPYK